MSEPRNMKNSELHHKLKNQPGEKGDEAHTRPDKEGELSPEVQRTIENAKSETQLAEELKTAVEKD